MKLAVWDTYVRKQDGNVMHFDIVVPENEKNTQKIYGFGKQYLASKNEGQAEIDTEECQFCHIESASGEMKEAIEKDGYQIIEMDDIPSELPSNPSRTAVIQHLRAFYPEYRFADFAGKSFAEIEQLLKKTRGDRPTS